MKVEDRGVVVAVKIGGKVWGRSSGSWVSIVLFLFFLYRR